MNIHKELCLVSKAEYDEKDQEFIGRTITCINLAIAEGCQKIRENGNEFSGIHVDLMVASVIAFISDAGNENIKKAQFYFLSALRKNLSYQLEKLPDEYLKIQHDLEKEVIAREIHSILSGTLIINNITILLEIVRDMCAIIDVKPIELKDIFNKIFDEVMLEENGSL